MMGLSTEFCLSAKNIFADHVICSQSWAFFHDCNVESFGNLAVIFIK